MAASVGLFCFACTDGGAGPAEPDVTPVQLRLAPHFATTGATTTAATIHRVRLTARDAGTAAVLAAAVLDVDPGAETWTLTLTLTLPDAQPRDVIVLMELLNEGGGVEWSGETAPLRVQPGTTSPPQAPVQLFQGPPANLAVRSITIQPRTADVVEGDSVVLTAVTDPATGPLVFWRSLADSIAIISSTGIVRTLRDGAARIVASAGPRADTVLLSARQRVAAMRLQPDSQRLGSLGSTATFAAVVLDPRGAVIADATVIWTVADSGVARELGGGAFVAVANGRTTIMATSMEAPNVRAEGVLVISQRAARVVLSPAAASFTALGERQTFTAAVLDAGGSTMAADVAWRSADPRVVTVDGNGAATAVAVGSTRIDAVTGAGTPDSVVGSAAVNVSQVIRRVVVEPASATLEAVGDTVRFSAQARDANDHQVADAHITWSSEQPEIASVDASGLVQSRAAGSVLIVATAGGVSGTAAVTTVQRVTRIAVTPASSTLTALGATVQLRAEAVDRNGVAVSGRTPQWSSSAAATAAVSATGLVTAVGNGQASIVAALDGVSGSATVTVQQVVERVVVEPAELAFDAVGSTAQLTALALDANDLPVSERSAAWTSSDPAVASVSADGLVTAHANGTATITASIDGVRASVAVAVQQAVSSVAVLPAADTVTAGEQVTFTAAAYDAAGAPIAGQTFAWNVQDTSLASVTAGGVVTGRHPGTTQVSATSGGVTGTATVVVQARSEPAVFARHAGDAQAAAAGTTLPVQLAVLVSDAAGLPLAGVAVEWVVTAGGGSLSAATATTDANGRAYVSFTLGTVAGSPQTAEARLAGFASLVFTATAQPGPVSSVTVTPATDSLAAVGQTTALAVALQDAYGNGVSEAVTWSSLDTGVATVAADGVVTAMANGTARIVATATGGAADTALITVQQVAVSLLLDSDSIVLLTGATSQLAATVTDANGTAVAGAIVAWSTADAAVANVDATGLVTAGAVLSGSTVVRAAYGELADSLILNVLGPAGVTKLWLGATASWEDPANWSPTGVPNAVDTVWIPAGTGLPPLLGGNASVGGLVLDQGRKLDLGTFTLTAYGHLLASDTIHNGLLALAGSGGVSGVLPRTQSSGARTLAGRTVVQGDLTVTGGSFMLGGHTAAVTGNFATAGGRLIMTAANDTLRVAGDVVFDNNNTIGWLTDGVLIARGNFATGLNSYEAFSPSGNHKVLFRGSASQTISLSYAGSGTSGRHFQHFEVDNPAGVVINGDHLYVNGDARISSGTVTAAVHNAHVTGNIYDPSDAGWQLPNTYLYNPALATPNRLASNLVIPVAVTLQQPLSTTGNVTVTGGSLTLNGRTLTAGGSFATAGGLLVMTNPADVLDVAGNVTFDNHNTIGKLTAGVIRVQGNFATGPNSYEAFSPSGTHRVLLNGSSQQTIALSYAGSGTSGRHFQDLEISNPAGVVVTNDHLFVNGTVTLTNGTLGSADRNAYLAGHIVDASGTRWQMPNTYLSTAAPALPAAVGGNWWFVGTTALQADLHVTGNAVLPTGGTLTLNSRTLRVDGNFATTGGLLRMLTGADRLDVTGTTTFDGGNTIGSLTDGVLVARGNFTTGANSYEAFSPSGNHTVRFAGSSPQTVTLSHQGTGTSSRHFQHLEVAAGSDLTFTSLVHILGSFTVPGIARILAGQTLETYGPVTVPSGGEIVNDGTLRYAAGYAPTGTITNGSSGTVVQR